MIYLLKTTLSSSNKDQLLILPPAERMVSDSAQLWKLLLTAFDRITGGKFSLSQKLDQARSTSLHDNNVFQVQSQVLKYFTKISAVTPIMEDEETEEEPKERKFRFVKHKKLLSKRLSYAGKWNVDLIRIKCP